MTLKDHDVDEIADLRHLVLAFEPKAVKQVPVGLIVAADECEQGDRLSSRAREIISLTSVAAIPRSWCAGLT